MACRLQALGALGANVRMRSVPILLRCFCGCGCGCSCCPRPRPIRRATNLCAAADLRAHCAPFSLCGRHDMAGGADFSNYFSAYGFLYNQKVRGRDVVIVCHTRAVFKAVRGVGEHDRARKAASQ